MKTAKFIFCPAALLLTMLAVCLAGCGERGGSGDKLITDANKTNLNRVCNLYGLFQTKNGWVGPENEEAFKAFIVSNPERILKRMGVDKENVDGIFSSERDGQRFDIRYAVEGNPRGEPEPIIFEKTGVEGKRLVGFTATVVREVDDAEYQRLYRFFTDQ